MSTVVRRIGIAVVLGALSFTATPASAQQVSLGYQWQRFDMDEIFFDEGSVTAPLGFNIDVAGPITSALDAFGQFDWSRKSETIDIVDEEFGTTVNFMTFGAGLRWIIRADPVIKPFVQGLFGVAHTSVQWEVPGVRETSSAEPMLQIGGGVAIPLGSKSSALGQFDWRRIFRDDEGMNSIRFVAGVRLGIR